MNTKTCMGPLSIAKGEGIGISPPYPSSRISKLLEDDTKLSSVWKTLSGHDQRDVFEEVRKKLREKELDEEREIREKCSLKFAALVESIPAITYRTKWRDVSCGILSLSHYGHTSIT